MFSKEMYIVAEEKLQIALLDSLERELGRSLTSAEEDKVRALVTYDDVVGTIKHD